MDKKVLAIYYTQSGQLGEIVDYLTRPLIEAGVKVENVRVRLKDEFSFPWTADRFFSVMPDCMLDVPGELAPFHLQEEKYDLVILGYQAWFLSPSIPFNTLLNHPVLKKVIDGTNVITVTGARNMWLNAFVRVKKLIHATGGHIVGNIALVDTHPNPVSFVTIFHWMLHGKKDKYLNIFPPPGVPEADIKHCSVFGEQILKSLKENIWSGLQDDLVAVGAVKLNYNLMVIESTAPKIFKVWAKIIAGKKNKLFWTRAFKYYLLIAFTFGAPLLITLDAIFLRFFTPRRIKAKKAYFLNLN